jgi:hypothetical protein
VAVSPDGKWASVYRAVPKPGFFLVAVDGGKEQLVDIPELEGRTAPVIAWLRGGRYLVWGNRPGNAKQHFIWNPTAGQLRVVSPPGSAIGLASDDGTRILTASPTGSLYTLAVEDGKLNRVQGVLPGDQFLRWSPDDQFVFAAVPAENRRDFSIFRINVSNGVRTLWKRVEPDPQANTAAPEAITPDGNTYAYIYFRGQSELFLARGLR